MTTPLRTSSHFEANGTKLAFGGGVFLAVWTSLLKDSGSNRDVIGRRYALDGTPLDETAFPITRLEGAEGVGCIAFDGTNFFVVYNTSGGASAVRVTPAGRALDPLGIRMDATFAAEDIAFDGTSYVIVGGSRALHVSRAGAVLHDLPLGNAFAPAVAFNGTEFLVTYRRGVSTSVYTMHGRKVSTSGVLGTEFLVDSQVTRPDFDSPTASSLVSNGSDWFVFYNDFESVVGARITAAGTPVGAVDLGISVKSSIDATYFGGGYYVFSAGTPGLQAAKVSDAGAVVAGPATFSGSYQGPISPSVAHDGSNPFVVFYEQNGLVSEVVGRRFTQALGALAPNQLVGEYANLEDHPAVAFNGENYLVVWRDFTEDGGERVDLVGTRVTPDRRVLDPAGIVFDDGGGVQSPNVTSNGTDWLVTWFDRVGNLRGARLGRNGTLLDPSGFPVAEASSGTSVYGPIVASDGTDYLATWTAQTGSASVIRGGRITAAGTRLDGASGFALSQTAGSAAPSLAWNGTHYLVAWHATNVHGTRVTASGSRVDTSDLVLALGGRAPSVASNGSDWLVSWAEPGSNIDIHAVRVRADGLVLDAPGPLLTSTGLGPARTVWDGAEYLVAWSDARHAMMNPFGSNDNYDVMAGRVTTAGTLLDPNGFLVAGSVEGEWSPAVAAGRDQVHVVYPRFDPAPPFATLRVRGRMIAERSTTDGGAGGESSGGAGGDGDSGDGGAPEGGTGGTPRGGSGGAQGGTSAGGSSVGGSSGTGPGTGGSAASSTGGTGGSSGNGKSGNSDDDGGCGCRTGKTSQRGLLAALIVATAFAAMRRRRRR